MCDWFLEISLVHDALVCFVCVCVCVCVRVCVVNSVDIVTENNSMLTAKVIGYSTEKNLELNTC